MSVSRAVIHRLLREPAYWWRYFTGDPDYKSIVLNSRTEYIVEVYRDMVYGNHQKRIYALEINANLFVYIGDFTFDIRARAERHVIRAPWARGNSRLNKGRTFIKQAIPLKTYRYLRGRNETFDCMCDTVCECAL